MIKPLVLSTQYGTFPIEYYGSKLWIAWYDYRYLVGKYDYSKFNHLRFQQAFENL